jgi:mannose/cellobiose epimerase-like protein (N-acyl-D-glucosamine 2-epimerase family)
MVQVPFDAVRTWMFEAALPFWAERGVDAEHGGFFEELSADGAPTACDFKRLRVICRQTYVFSHAALLGWPKGEPLSQLGFEYMRERARLPDGGWARRLARDGRIIDATPELYDLAFVIFAAAWRYRLSREPEARACAIETFAFVRERMTAPGGGFWRALPASAERAQNPHMHLTEACLAAFEATGEAQFLDVARELVSLFARRFFDGATLGERFDDDWARTSAVLEPGHHFEWVWILAQYQRLSGDDVTALAQAAAAFAERHGVEPESGAVYDAIAADGAPLRRSSRIWTNTERIKAALGLFELTGADPRPVLASSLRLIFQRYFADQIPGLWIDQFDGDGAPIDAPVPASCVYHLFLAFSEVLRLEDRIRAL